MNPRVYVPPVCDCFLPQHGCLHTSDPVGADTLIRLAHPRSRRANRQPSKQDLPAVRNLALVYTLAGADCIDVAADEAVIEAAR